MKYSLLLSSLFFLACTNVRATEQREDKAVLQNSVAHKVPLLATLCEKCILNNFERYDLQEALDNEALPADFYKTMFLGRLKYFSECIEHLQNVFNQEISEAGFAYDVTRHHDFNDNVNHLSLQCWQMLIQYLPKALCTELTSQEAKTIIEQIELLDAKHLRDFITIFTHATSPNNTAQLQAACINYGLAQCIFKETRPMNQKRPYHIYYAEEANTPLLNDNSPTFYATGKRVEIDYATGERVEGDKADGFLYPGLEVQYTIHDADDKEIERFIVPGTQECDQLPVAYAKFQGYTICAVPEYITDENGKLCNLQVSLFINDRYTGSMRNDFEAHDAIEGTCSPTDFTKAFFDKHTGRVVFANDQYAISVRLPEYFTALIHATLTLPELMYVLVLSRLDYLTTLAACVGKQIPEELFNAIRHHPVLETTIKQKNIHFYRDLVAFLSDIKNMPVIDNAANGLDEYGFPILTCSNYRGMIGARG